MRPILFKKWIPKITIKTGQSTTEAKSGTNQWESDFINEGVFHGWYNAYEEFDTGAGNYTVALVEIADGTILEVLPSNLKFKLC